MSYADFLQGFYIMNINPEEIQIFHKTCMRFMELESTAQGKTAIFLCPVCKNEVRVEI